MHVEGYVKCTQTNFDGHGLSGFGDFALFVGLKKTAKFPFQTMDYHGGQKIELPQKIMQAELA